MATTVNYLNVWLEGTPVVASGTQEFDIWLGGAPLVELDEGGLGIPTFQVFLFGV